MNVRPIHSLSGRLNAWLAIQTFVGLGLVSVAVYWLTVIDLRERQIETLTHKRELIEHVLSEAKQDQDLANLKHKLDDFFLGHRDMALTLIRSDGSALYDNAAAVATAHSAQHINFRYPALGAAGGEISARMVLNTTSDDQFLHRLAATLLGAAMTGALVVSFGSFVLVRIGLGPVHFLVDQTMRLEADNLRQRLDGSGQPLEFQPLVKQFNALLERLRRAYEQLEGFNADVAHELRTPLSTLITSIELAMRRTHDPSTSQELLGSNLEELRRMAGIVNDMLFLSHANSGAEARREPVASLAALAQDVAEYHDAAIAEADLRLAVEGDASGDFDASLLKRALSNLLGNATRYASPQSTVRISIDRPDNGSIRLAVINQGQEIAAADLLRLFDRFYRVDAARPHASVNHGLGLSIVAAIARMHQGHPFAHSDGGETRIGFTVPSAAH